MQSLAGRSLMALNHNEDAGLVNKIRTANYEFLD